jgi:hypothetical protein
VFVYSPPPEQYLKTLEFSINASNRAEHIDESSGLSLSCTCNECMSWIFYNNYMIRS